MAGHLNGKKFTAEQIIGRLQKACVIELSVAW